MHLYVAMVVMLVSGALNTLVSKYQDNQYAPAGRGQKPTQFDAPFVQTFIMFMGEFSCLLVFLVGRRLDRRRRHIHRPCPKWLFIVPSACDWTASTMVFFSTLIISASAVQMIRGSVVIFTALFSVIFLKRRLFAHHYVGVACVCVGIVLVALTTILYHPPSGSAPPPSGIHPFVGVVVCTCSQMASAALFVIEEKVLSRYQVAPIEAIGLEGMFGCTIGVVLLSVLTPLKVSPTLGALHQITHSLPLLISSVGVIFTIAFFNVTGITVTKRASAVARSTLDCCRTILVWAGELVLGWNTFHWIQLLGFAVMAFGTMLYNRLIRIKFLEGIGEAERLVYEGYSPDAMHNQKQLWPASPSPSTTDVLSGQASNPDSPLTMAKDVSIDYIGDYDFDEPLLSTQNGSREDGGGSPTWRGSHTGSGTFHPPLFPPSAASMPAISINSHTDSHAHSHPHTGQDDDPATPASQLHLSPQIDNGGRK
ncbi:unnamed protein product [Vitrella brassicaformis CCMP3155]|uniref:EamA domain-containing protein n=2 Tax=Vitrella brassicaformis TaxID=1169539 RepID=A0A0G4EGQ0_VITBC|nr:unnamed protein product [Vitrella brassicaformis CCMP3155]|eukprot:CEL95422.1 unnamed protein product [Vitrella brassicaformis CCMP3155]